MDTSTSWIADTNYWAKTFNETTLTAPSGVSILCLSCHDGVIAVDAYGSNAGSTFIPSANSTYLGTDMRDDHPISVTYPAGDLATSRFVVAPTGVKVDFGGVKRVECASCHDPHNANVATAGLGIGKFLRVKKENSDICLACHIK
ncbi:MAG: cytochrome c3 family protein [Thermodesulfobacteriota bacterium]